MDGHEKFDYWRKEEDDNGVCTSRVDKLQRKTIEVQIGETKVSELNISPDRPYDKILLCPHCLNAYYVGYYEEDYNHELEPDDNVRFSYIGITSEENFHNHVKQCKPVMKEGINKVESKSSKQAMTFVVILSCWCQADTHWNSVNTLSTDFIIDDGHEDTVTYVFIEDGLPVSFATFMYGCFTPEGAKIEDYALFDLFTFSEFRNRGYATRLINHGIKDLDIKQFGIHYPLTEHSYKIVKKYNHIRV